MGNSDFVFKFAERIEAKRQHSMILLINDQLRRLVSRIKQILQFKVYQQGIIV